MVKRRKVRKSINQESPSEKKAKDKDGEVAIARGRLAGALKGILNRADDSDEQESSSSSNHLTNSNSKKLSRDSSPALWKKKPNKTIENEDHQAYFMRLFDRSVDLAQFDINTPLYPLCRAWIQNHLLSRHQNNDGLLEIKHDNKETDVFELRERPLFLSEDRDIYKLPLPEPLPKDVHTLRIPEPIPREIQKINLNRGSSELPTREELLQSHLENWSAVRKRWRVASQKNEVRYANSKAVLTRMFEKSQVLHPIN